MTSEGCHTFRSWPWACAATRPSTSTPKERTEPLRGRSRELKPCARRAQCASRALRRACPSATACGGNDVPGASAPPAEPSGGCVSPPLDGAATMRTVVAWDDEQHEERDAARHGDRLRRVALAAGSVGLTSCVVVVVLSFISALRPTPTLIVAVLFGGIIPVGICSFLRVSSTARGRTPHATRGCTILVRRAGS